MNKTILLFFVISALFLLDARRPFTPKMSIFPNSLPKSRLLMQAAPEYTVKYYDQTLDHFTYSSKRTFKMRYLENLNYWDRQNKGLN